MSCRYQFNVFHGGPEVEDVFLSKTEHVVAARWNKLFLRCHPCRGQQGLWRARHLGRLGITPDEAIATAMVKNDLTMFDAVGTSVAMGNAWDVVKDRATHITTDVDDGSIWNACVELGDHLGPRCVSFLLPLRLFAPRLRR